MDDQKGGEKGGAIVLLHGPKHEDYGWGSAALCALF
jgi:hypothetical protein